MLKRTTLSLGPLHSHGGSSHAHRQSAAAAYALIFSTLSEERVAQLLKDVQYLRRRVAHLEKVALPQDHSVRYVCCVGE